MSLFCKKKEGTKKRKKRKKDGDINVIPATVMLNDVIVALNQRENKRKIAF